MPGKTKFKVVRKRHRQGPLDDIENLQALASQASRRAVREAREAKVAITYIEDGRLLQRSTDQSIVELKKLEQRPKLNLEELLCQA